MIVENRDPPRQAWRSFLSRFAPAWEPGDHVAVIARTKGGKSYLVGHGLLPVWDYTLTLDVKNDGSVPGGRKVKGYPTWRSLTSQGPHRYRVAPPYGASARQTFHDVFAKVWTSGRESKGSGSWVIYVDELKILSDKLGLRDHLETFYVAGRSRGITMIGSTQAPRDVPSEFYDQSTWFFFGPGMRDTRTLDRLGEIAGDRQQVRSIVPRLDFERHEFLVLGPNFEAVTALRR